MKFTEYGGGESASLADASDVLCYRVCLRYFRYCRDVWGICSTSGAVVYVVVGAMPTMVATCEKTTIR